MMPYFNILQNSLPRSGAFWTEPYQDPKIGTVASLAVAVYDRTGPIPVLLGVASIDVALDNLGNGITVDDTSLSNYILQQNRCIPSTFNQCQLEYYRGANKCGINNNSTCLNYSESSLCTDYLFNTGFFPSMKLSLPYDESCCSTDLCILATQNDIYVGAILGGLVGLLIIALIIWLIIYCCCRKKEDPFAQQNEKTVDIKKIDIEINYDKEKPMADKATPMEPKKTIPTEEKKKVPEEVELENNEYKLQAPKGDS
jgi:hypothetical protein